MEEKREKYMEVTNRSRGYAHVRMSGVCGLDVTREDVAKRFYHPYFGGRDAGVDGKGKFWVTVHTD